MLSKSPKYLKYYSRDKFQTTTCRDMFTLLLNGPLPLNFFDCYSLVLLTTRHITINPKSPNYTTFVFSDQIYIDSQSFNKICKGEVLQAPLL